MPNLIKTIKDQILTTDLKTITPYINLENTDCARLRAGGKAASDGKKQLQTISSFSAQCDVASMLFYFKFQVVTTSSEIVKHTFNGNAGGIAIPGGGVYFGDIYLNNTVDNLFANTVSFAFTATPVYLAVMFFDSSSNLLGHFQSGGVSVVSGTGGGSGSWEKN